MRSTPAGKTSIGSGSSNKGNPYRCPTCGRYKTK
nr:MAG TPA: C2H2 type zinc-finger protein [Caudoviricetes sp.]